MASITSQPDITFNIVPAASTVSNNEQKVLFVGQKLPAGTATAGALTQDIANNTSTINTLSGEGSMMSEMLRSARALNGVVQFDAIFLDDDGSATDATSVFTITGGAQEDGNLTFAAGSRANYSFVIDILNGDTADEIGTALEAAINADDDAPYTAANVSGVVTLTSKNGGTLGNLFGIETSGIVDGVSVALTGWSGGTNDPDVSTILDAVGEIRYQTVVWPYISSIETVKDFMDARFNVTNDVQDGVVILATNDSKANLDTLGNVHNSLSTVIIGDLAVSDADYIGPAVHELFYSKISQVAAIRSLRFTEGESIAQFVIGRNGALDSFGGPAIASLPYFNTPMRNIALPDANRGFSRTEIEDLTDAGITIIGSNRTRTDVLLGEVVTTYKTDAASNPDASFKFLNYVDTSSNVREYFFNNSKAQFAQSRLTEGDLIAGRNMANAESIAAFFVGLYNDLSGPDFVLVQAGEEALQFFKSKLTITIDLSIGKVTANMQVPIVTQFREMVATMQIAFSTNG